MQRHHQFENVNDGSSLLSADNFCTSDDTLDINKYFPDVDCCPTLEKVIDRLLLVFDNKYWVVQCKYCDLISKLDFDNYRSIYGERSQVHKVCIKY